MIIDCQTHVFPDAYARILARNPRPPRAILQGDGYLVTYGDVQSFRLEPEAYSIERKIRDMDAAGIDVSVLSLNMPGPELLAPDVGVLAARACNDYLGEVAGQHPGRLAGLACLPWQDAPAALEEMDHAINDLGLRGIMLYSHVGEGPVDATACEPLYGRAEELRVPVVLHPCVPPWAGEIRDYSMIPMVGLMVDHSFAMLRLILSGVMERHPRLQVVQPHCGGVLPYLWGRIRNQTEEMGRGVERITRSPTSYYSRVYLDTVSPSKLALRYAYDFAGPDRLIFGTDHPWVKAETFLQLLEEMEMPESDKAKILGWNAQRLFRIG